MAHVDDANTLVEAAIVNIDNMSAAKREYGIDAFGLERLGDEVTARRYPIPGVFLLQLTLLFPLHFAGRCLTGTNHSRGFTVTGKYRYGRLPQSR
jgi:hypothetical protein